MKFHEIEMIGSFFLSAIPVLPEWTVDDIHRLVYVETEDNVYYGGATYWIELGKIFTDVGTSDDPITGEPFHLRKYLSQMVDGNIRFTYDE